MGDDDRNGAVFPNPKQIARPETLSVLKNQVFKTIRNQLAVELKLFFNKNYLVDKMLAKFLIYVHDKITCLFRGRWCLISCDWTHWNL